MSFLDRFLARPPAYDPFCGNSHGPISREYLARGDFEALGRIYGRQTAQNRWQWCRALGELWSLDDPLPATVKSAEAMAVLGTLQLHMAWRERGAQRAHLTSEDAFARMHARLERAEIILESAAEARPGDCVIWSSLVACNTGLDGNEVRANALRNGLLTCEDLCPGAASMHLMYTLRKWFGTQYEMWEEIAVLARPPRRAAWLGLEAYGHIEDWLWYVSMRDNEEAAQAHEARMASEAYVEKLLDLDARFHDLAASEGPDMSGERFWAHGQFAALWEIMGRFNEARPHVEAMGAHPGDGPRRYLTDDGKPMESWNYLRRRCGLPPLRA